MGNARNLADNLPPAGGFANALTGALGNRNIIINGAMNVSQRQTSSSNVGNKYVLDRFFVYRQNASSTYTCCLLYTSPSPRDATLSRMPSSA